MTFEVSTTMPTQEEIARIIREAGVDEYAAASRIAELFAQKQPVEGEIEATITSAKVQIADDLLAWLKERGLYDPAEHQDDGLDVAELLTWHEEEIQRPRRSPEEVLASPSSAPIKPATAREALALAISWIEDLPRKNASHQMLDHVLEELRAPLRDDGPCDGVSPSLDADTEKLLRRIHFVLNVRKGDPAALGSDVWEGSDGFPRSRPFTDIFCEEIDTALSGKAPTGRVVGAKPAFDLHDFVTHRRVWRSALVSDMGNANRRGDDISYWKHEIEVFDRCFDLIEPFAKAANADEAANLLVRIRDCWDEDQCPSWLVVERLVSELARRAAGVALRTMPPSSVAVEVEK